MRYRSNNRQTNIPTTVSACQGITDKNNINITKSNVKITIYNNVHKRIKFKQKCDIVGKQTSLSALRITEKIHKCHVRGFCAIT